MASHKTENLAFRPHARILRLLGDELIADSGIAVFELAKNAHDADARKLTIELIDIEDKKKGKIVITDDGVGMDWEIVKNIWLEPGTDYRALQKRKKYITPKFGRIPLGEKGVGRFAAHKLGEQVRLVTKTKNKPEMCLDLDWNLYKTGKYLDEVKNRIYERNPEVFRGAKTGTQITITNLRETWNRRMVRDLSRAITSICSPFSGPKDFEPNLVIANHKDWLNGLLTVDQIKKYSLFEAHCEINGTDLTYDYKFIPWKVMDRVRARTKVVSSKEPIKLSRIERSKDKTRPSLDLSKHEIGPVKLDLYIYDLDSAILALGVTDKRGLKDYLKENGGVRVYRDGVRIYNYGEPGTDWLDLEGRRVNTPTGRLSNNLVIGAVSLDGSQSSGLIEKTNREGFVTNDASRDLVEALQFAIIQIETERKIDKEHIRLAYSSKRFHEPVLDDLEKIEKVARKEGFEPEIRPFLKRIEKDYVDIRDRFLTSASAGLSLMVVIHEVEKGLVELKSAVQIPGNIVRVKNLSKHLAELVEGLGAIARQSGNEKEHGFALIKQAVFNTELRIKYHKVNLDADYKGKDFEIKCSKRLIISTLMNLIDNSIWWLDSQAPEKKKISIFVSRDLKGGPAIIVADNNTQGFIDPPEMMIQPFFSRRPHGMGLGLHLADQVMKIQGGSLQFPEPGDVGLPKEFKAIVALVFGGKK